MGSGTDDGSGKGKGWKETKRLSDVFGWYGTHLVEVVLVQLANEACKVRMLEHPREDSLCELVHILDDEAIALGTPRYDMREGGVFEHSETSARY